MRFLPLSLVILLAGCEVAYFSSDVKPTTGDAQVQVSVLPMTPETVTAANRSSYTPRALPAIFRHATPIPAAPGTGALPDPASREQARSAQSGSAVPPALVPGPYRIGISDVVLLATTAPGNSVEQLTGLLAAQNRRQGYTVQDDGTIAVPNVGRIAIADLTIEEAEAEVFKVLVDKQIDPAFSLEIAEFNSKRVSVGGAVKSPALVPITLKPVTLEEALQTAGGVAVANFDDVVIRLLRGTSLYEISYRDMLAKPALRRLALGEGDAVFVDSSFNQSAAESFFRDQVTLSGLRGVERDRALAAVQAGFSMNSARADEERANFNRRIELGAVKRDFAYIAGEAGVQGRFALPFEQRASLADALFNQQGIASSTGNPRQIYVLRASSSGDQILAYQLDARNAAMLVMATKFELRPNDIVFVAQQPVTRWSRVVDQITPSLLIGGAQTIAASQ